MVRDSADIERKIYSSTPDQTMLMVQPLVHTFVDDEADFSNYTNYEGDDIDDVTLASISEKSLKRLKKQGPLNVAGSLDYCTERDEESLELSIGEK